MSPVLSALDAAIERYGRSAVSDPVALAGALRATTDPPDEPVVVALAEAAGAGAVGSLRSALSRDAEPAAALAEAVAAVDPAVDPTAPTPARWACTMLGSALGLLPRDWAAEAGPLPVAVRVAGGADAGPTEEVQPVAGRVGGVAPADPTRPIDGVTGRGPRSGAPPGAAHAEPDGPTTAAEPPAGPDGGRAPGKGRLRTPLVVVALVVALIAAAAGIIAALPGGAPVPPGAPAAAAPTPAAPPATGPAAASTEPQTVEDAMADAPADPRQAFLDPGLRALAEPYIARPGARCVGREPIVNQQESVTCDLGGGYIAIFSRMLTADLLRNLRSGFLDGLQATPQSVRSLRWKFVPDRPGVKTGIRAGSAETGEGVRVRYLDQSGLAKLYFDQESTASSVFIGAADPAVDVDDLRTFWADPAG